MKVPVVGLVVQSKEADLNRFIDSIDFPVETLFIVNSFESLEPSLDALASSNRPLIDKISVSHVPGYIGVPASWNLIIKCFPQSPFWVLSSDDVKLNPGFLSFVYNSAISDPNIGIIHGSQGDFGVGSWDFFLIRDIIVKIMGLFDENSSPEGCEGADYFFRTAHRPLKKLLIPEVGYCLDRIPGNNDFAEIDYLRNKWGDWRVTNVNKSPFGREGFPISCCFYDINRHREVKRNRVSE